MNGKDEKRRPNDAKVYLGKSKRSEWHLFSLADWIWTWQFANGLTVFLLIRQTSPSCRLNR